MRNWHGNLSPLGRWHTAGALSAYAINSLDPPLVLDFIEDYYRTGGSASTFDDALNFSRPGNATMVDSDGVLKWAPHNLLRYSEQFGNAAWNKASSSTVDTNVASAPDGSATADRINFAADTNSRVEQIVTTTATDYTFSVWLRSESGTVTLTLRNAGAEFTDIDVGETWALYTHTFTETDTSAFIGIKNRDSTARSILAWGVHLYRSDLGGMVDNPATGNSYVPTTDSARYLPRVGNHVYNGSEWVNKGLLLESEARTNLVNYSTITAVNYSVVDATITDNAATDLGGTSTSARLTGSGALGTQRLGRSVTITGNSCFSWTIRKDSTHRYFQILQGSDAAFYQNFDLLSGVLGTDGGGVVNAGVIDEGDFWRIFAVFNVVTSAVNYLYLASSASATYGQGSSTSDYADLAFHQVEEGSTSSSYIPTAGSTVTRAAETLDVAAADMPWPEPVVIGEELVTNGTFDSDSDWSLGTGWTISGGRVNFSNPSGSAFTQNISTVFTGSVFLVEFDSYQDEVTGVVFNGLTPGAAVLSLISSVGTRRSYIGALADNKTRLSFSAIGGSTVEIDNISAKEISPLAVSIQMDGAMTYADNDLGAEIKFVDWVNGGEYIQQQLGTNGSNIGRVFFWQRDGATSDSVSGAAYSPGINVPFNIASRHGSTFINGAVDGTALTENDTPTALPDLSATDFDIGPTFMGNIGKLRVWAEDLGNEGIEEAST